jgi:predicted small integral membrane protein
MDWSSATAVMLAIDAILVCTFIVWKVYMRPPRGSGVLH